MWLSFDPPQEWGTGGLTTLDPSNCATGCAFSIVSWPRGLITVGPKSAIKPPHRLGEANRGTFTFGGFRPPKPDLDTLSFPRRVLSSLTTTRWVS